VNDIAWIPDVMCLPDWQTYRDLPNSRLECGSSLSSLLSSKGKAMDLMLGLGSGRQRASLVLWSALSRKQLVYPLLDLMLERGSIS
jgi:hypothetical protein